MKSLLVICALLYGAVSSSFSQPSHEIFDGLLRKHVSSTGKVDYRGFIQDSIILNRYLNLLSRNPPDDGKWSRNDQMAYWINAYNAFTIKLIADHYPVKSIKDIGDKIQIPFVNTPWDIKFIRQGNRLIDLNFIEHTRLRKLGDPRIHMVIVCASKSCPALLNQAYETEQLDQQLTTQTQKFLSDPTRNKIKPGEAQISMIFSWYKSDFAMNGSSVRAFIARYSTLKIKADTPISFLDYDWSLNE
jgi:hypothetical protein